MGVLANADLATLAHDARNGNEDAVAALLEKVRPLMLKICRHFSFPGADRDDAMGECLLEFWERVLPTFATENYEGHFFGLVVSACWGRLSTNLRNAKRLKRGGQVRFEDVAQEPATHTQDPAAELEDQEEAHAFLRWILDSASPLAKRAIPLIIEGNSAAKCDAILCVSPGSTRQAIRLLGRKLGIARRSAVEQVDDQNGKVIAVFESAADAEKHLQISQRHIGEVLRGEARTAGGFNWRYCRAQALERKAEAEAIAMKRAFVSAAKPKDRRRRIVRR